MTSIYRYF